MKEKKFSYKELKYLAVGVAVLALLFFALASVAKETFYAVLFFLLAGVSLVVGCVLLYFSHRGNRAHSNYFLFDRRRKEALTLRELTFSFVDDNLTYYISGFAENALSLWQGIPKELAMDLTANPAFRTPVAFQMMYELSDLSPEDISIVFAAADKATVAFVCRAVKAGGDKEMADIIFEMKCAPERLGSRVVPFFTKNKRVFEGRIFRYIHDHIEEYEMNR